MKESRVVVAEAPPLPAPVVVADRNMFDVEEYRALVAELGVDDSAIRNYEFREFLLAEGIPVYEYGKVCSFLDAKVRQEAKAVKNEYLTWVWKPICGQYPDISKNASEPDRGNWIFPSTIGSLGSAMSNALSNANSALWQQAAGVASQIAPTHSPRTYARALPHAVLLTVKKIRDRFKDAVHFYASDYAVLDPDPFLLVTGDGLDYYVIERWDEPGFRSA